eukprot:scaffold5586_cov124-Isochrysis_galbana.AAC.14
MSHAFIHLKTVRQPVKPLEPRHPRRRIAIAIRLQVRSTQSSAVGREQPFTRGVVALDRRLVHGRVAVPVEQLDVETPVAQPAAHAEISRVGLCGPLDGVATKVVCRVQVGTRLINKVLCHPELATPHRPVQRTCAVDRPRVRVCAVRDQPPARAEVAVARGPVETGAAVLLPARVRHRDANARQRRKHLHLPCTRAPVQRGGAVVVHGPPCVLGRSRGANGVSCDELEQSHCLGFACEIVDGRAGGCTTAVCTPAAACTVHASRACKLTQDRSQIAIPRRGEKRGQSALLGARRRRPCLPQLREQCSGGSGRGTWHDGTARRLSCRLCHPVIRRVLDLHVVAQAAALGIELPAPNTLQPASGTLLGQMEPSGDQE